MTFYHHHHPPPPNKLNISNNSAVTDQTFNFGSWEHLEQLNQILNPNIEPSIEPNIEPNIEPQY